MVFKKKGGYKVVYRKAKRTYHRARGFGAGLGGGTFGPLIQGGIAGLAASTLNGRIPYGSTIGIGAVGYFMKNPTLMTLAGMQAAQLIPNPLAGGAAATGGGYI
jgi:hypothetical protein